MKDASRFNSNPGSQARHIPSHPRKYGGFDRLPSSMTSSKDASGPSNSASSSTLPGAVPKHTDSENLLMDLHSDFTDSDDEMDLLSHHSGHSRTSSFSPSRQVRSSQQRESSQLPPHPAFLPSTADAVKQIRFKKIKSQTDSTPTPSSTTKPQPPKQQKWQPHPPSPREETPKIKPTSALGGKSVKAGPKAKVGEETAPKPPRSRKTLATKPSSRKRVVSSSSDDDHSGEEESAAATKAPKRQPAPRPSRKQKPTATTPSTSKITNSNDDLQTPKPRRRTRAVASDTDSDVEAKVKANAKVDARIPSRKPAAFPMALSTPPSKSPSPSSSRPPSSFPYKSPIASEKEALKHKPQKRKAQTKLPISPLHSQTPDQSPVRPGRQVFPMQQSDFDVSPKKRMSDGDSSDRETKRLKEDELESILQRGKAAYEDVGDDSVVIDPHLLCPYCDEPLPTHPTTILTRLLHDAEKKSRPSPRPTNALGRKALIADFITVCHRHHFEIELAPKGEAQGWPKTINWKQVANRVSKMKEVLQCIVLDDRIRPNPNPRSKCFFWQELLEQRQAQGARSLGGVRGQFATFEKLQPGYYGEQGSLLIQRTLHELFPLDTMDPDWTSPLTPGDFLERILVPEVATRLIMQDRKLTGEAGMLEAVTILRASAQYGVSMFPADNRLDGESVDVDIGMSDQILVDRARKRREEIEAEEAEWSEMNEDSDVGVKGPAKSTGPKSKPSPSKSKSRKVKEKIGGVTTSPRMLGIGKSPARRSAIGKGGGLGLLSPKRRKENTGRRPRELGALPTLSSSDNKKRSSPVKQLRPAAERSRTPMSRSSSFQDTNMDLSDMEVEVMPQDDHRRRRSPTRPTTREMKVSQMATTTAAAPGTARSDRWSKNMRDSLADEIDSSDHVGGGAKSSSSTRAQEKPGVPESHDGRSKCPWLFDM